MVICYPRVKNVTLLYRSISNHYSTNVVCRKVKKRLHTSFKTSFVRLHIRVVSPPTPHGRSPCHLTTMPLYPCHYPPTPLPVSLYPCVSRSLYHYIPVSVDPRVITSLCQSITVSSHLCVSRSQCHYIPVSLHPLVITSPCQSVTVSLHPRVSKSCTSPETTRC